MTIRVKVFWYNKKVGQPEKNRTGTFCVPAAAHSQHSIKVDTMEGMQASSTNKTSSR